MALEEIQQLFAQFKDYIQGSTFNAPIIINLNSDSASSVVNCADIEKKKEPKQAEPNDYTDEVVARAIMAINGKFKPLCEKQLYLGIIKVLSNKCGWSAKWQTSCDHINELPLIKEADLEIKCDYNNLKGPIGMRFASLEYPEWEDYEPKATERDVFLKNKALAHLFEEELDRQICMLH